jgi:putative tryptophan/tyrosine transport system substrate-binding protein
MSDMKRRAFITLLGGAAVTRPLVARAQQGERIRRIGVLQAISESDPEAHLRKAAFVGGLQRLGWTEGTNVTIDYRWAGADADRIRLYVTEITGMRPDVIWTSGALPLLPLKRATRTVPSTIQSAAGSLRASLDREATSLDSRWASSLWAGRYSRCSRRWRPG